MINQQDVTPVTVEVELPLWMDTMAQRQGIALSAVLEQALKETLGIV